jgi:selenoprotein W-related protein
LADKLLDRFKNKIAEVALVPSSGGAFEVSVGEERIFSKLQTGRFPDERQVIGEIEGKL